MTAEQFKEAFEDAAQRAHLNARRKGFHDHPRSTAEQIALLHSELSEMLEADRHGNPPSEHIPGFSGIAEEAADVIIRLMDMTQSLGLDLAGAIVAKMEYNANRPHLHGKKY